MILEIGVQRTGGFECRDENRRVGTGIGTGFKPEGNGVHLAAVGLRRGAEFGWFLELEREN